MKLSPEKFNGFLAAAGVGQRFMWRRAFACPCLNPHSGAAKPNCPLCGGKGYQWNDEVSGEAGMTNQATKRQQAQFGTWEPGDAVLTIPANSPLYSMGRYDRVRMLNSTDPFSLNLTRGQNDKMRVSVVQVDRVFWLNPAGNAVIEGGIPAVAADGTLTWEAGEPPTGTVYSITGVKFDEYFCYQDLPSDRAAHGGAALPKKAHLRKFDLFGR